MQSIALFVISVKRFRALPLKAAFAAVDKSTRRTQGQLSCQIWQARPNRAQEIIAVSDYERVRAIRQMHP